MKLKIIKFTVELLVQLQYNSKEKKLEKADKMRDLKMNRTYIRA